MKYKIFYLFSLASITVGCSIQPPDPTITVANGVRIYTTSADQQSTFMKDHGSSERFCLARGTDVADTVSTGVGASFGLADKSEDLSETSSKGAVSLGGRDSAVLITRELMYRTCEMIMNLNLSEKEALELFSQALKATVTVSKNQKDSGASSSSTSSTGKKTSTVSSSDDNVEKGVD